MEGLVVHVDVNNRPRFPESKILVIYTGGTIGMCHDQSGALSPTSGKLIQHVKALTLMHDEAYCEERFGPNTPNSLLVLPSTKNVNNRVLYTILEWECPMDSSDMTIVDWARIATQIEENYDSFDGFVVLHGTDTMSYSASALSFMLENLRKPVIITGSQIPIFEPRSDGADNFISALLIAATQDIPEVTLFFNKKLLRGNRTTKVSMNNFDAFKSPNCDALAISALKIEVKSHAIFRPFSNGKFRAHTSMNKNVTLLHIFPGISSKTIHNIMQPPTEGVVILTYGAGNIPSQRFDLHLELEEAVKRGVIIVNITQCLHGSVQTIYQTGQVLKNCKVIPGFDMTIEAALTKLSYVLSKNEWDFETKQRMMMDNLRGELTLQ
ncbi:L-asparaginase [Arctopsyche grandis]|uniref:L-asparaginase n=1 Tax=Arctopsyche grandis TaxID=121162 RepID=UPI00406D85DC